MLTDIERVNVQSISGLSKHLLDIDAPVLIDGFVNSWPAMQKWTPEFLLAEFGDRDVPVVTMRDFDYGNGVLNNVPLKEYLESIGALDENPIKKTDSDSDVNHYLAQVDINEHFPELVQDVDRLEPFEQETVGSTVIYIGGSLFSQLHYHPFGSATLSVISGQKRVRLFAPDQGKYLYPHSFYSHFPHLSKTHHKEPDPAEFPKFSQAQYVEVTVNPGEMLFFPIYWWHSIENLGVSVSITSFWNKNWNSRFLPPPGPRAAYLYEPVRRYANKASGAIRKVGRMASRINQ